MTNRKGEAVSELDGLLKGKTGWKCTGAVWRYNRGGHKLEVADQGNSHNDDRLAISHNDSKSTLGSISGVAVRLKAIGALA